MPDVLVLYVCATDFLTGYSSIHNIPMVLLHTKYLTMSESAGYLLIRT